MLSLGLRKSGEAVEAIVAPRDWKRPQPRRSSTSARANESSTSGRSGPSANRFEVSPTIFFRDPNLPHTACPWYPVP